MSVPRAPEVQQTQQLWAPATFSDLGFRTLGHSSRKGSGCGLWCMHYEVSACGVLSLECSVRLSPLSFPPASVIKFNICLCRIVLLVGKGFPGVDFSMVERANSFG